MEQQVHIVADIGVDVGAIPTGLRRGDALGVLRFGLVLTGLHDGVDLLVADKGALQPDRLVGPHWQKQRVAHADQLLRAGLIEDDAAIGQR